MPQPAPSKTFAPIVPATFFGMVLGIGGLGSAWRVAARVWGVPVWVGEVLVVAAVALWLVWAVLFAAKWAMAPAAGRAEAADPMMGFAVGLLPMSTMLVATLAKPWLPKTAEVVLVAGLIAGLVYAAWVMGRAWQGGRSLAATTPLMYLSPVGACFLGALGAGAYDNMGLAALLWGAGAIAWLVIEAAVLQRLMSEPVPVPQRATVGIQLAPPAVGCMSYLAFTPGPPDKLALALMGYALLQGLILLRLVPWLRQQPFGPGAWSYTFGMAALAVSSLLMLERGQAGVMAWLAPVLFVAANLMIGWIAARTLVLAARGRLLQPAR